MTLFIFLLLWYCLYLEEGKIKKIALNSKDFIKIESFDNINNTIFTNDAVIKIVEIKPINFNIKSFEEKNIILKNFENFITSFDSKLQFIIKSEKINIIDNINFIENISITKLIKNIDHSISKQTIKKDFANSIINQYINLLENISNESRNSCKSFYIVIYSNLNNYKNSEIIRKSYSEKLIASFNLLKNTLEECGNSVIELDNRKSIELIYSNIGILC